MPILIGSINQTTNDESQETLYNTEEILDPPQEKILTLKNALKLTLPDYSKLFITELAFSVCLFQASNTYMKVSKQTKEDFVLINSLSIFAHQLLAKLLSQLIFL